MGKMSSAQLLATKNPLKTWGKSRVWAVRSDNECWHSGMWINKGSLLFLPVGNRILSCSITYLNSYWFFSIFCPQLERNFIQMKNSQTCWQSPRVKERQRVGKQNIKQNIPLSIMLRSCLAKKDHQQPSRKLFRLKDLNRTVVSHLQ